jgi:hypothetical protein
MRKNRVGIEAVEARSVDAIRDGKGWQYEPKWDGFQSKGIQRILRPTVVAKICPSFDPPPRAKEEKRPGIN